MNKKIAFFDFDGTLTFRDSSKEFYRYLYKNSFFYNYYLKNTIFIILYQLRIIDYMTLKRRRIFFLVKKFSSEFLIEESKNFFKEFMLKQFKNDGKKAIIELQDKGFEVVIVSASLDLILGNIKEEFAIEIITNELQFFNGKFTGKLVIDKDCNFEEKVKRIKEKYNLEEYDEIYAFGDTKGDFAMLELANKSFLNYFKE